MYYITASYASTITTLLLMNVQSEIAAYVYDCSNLTNEKLARCVALVLPLV